MTFFNRPDTLKKQIIMKSFLKTLFVISFLLNMACSSDSNNNDNPNNLQNFTSSLCVNVTGPTAAYWDYAHGVPFPSTQIPTLANPGQQFIHSQYPALGFTMPQGYSGFEDQAGLGVNMIRNDNQVVWRYVPNMVALAQIPIQDVVANEVNQLFVFYNFNGDFEVVCSQNRTQNLGTMVVNQSSRLLRFGNITALLFVQTYMDPSLGSTIASVSMSSGPTAEYDNLVMNVFLPIHWQLLYIDNGVRDSDLDGTPDTQDNFPFDPTKQ